MTEATGRCALLLSKPSKISACRAHAICLEHCSHDRGYGGAAQGCCRSQATLQLQGLVRWLSEAAARPKLGANPQREAMYFAKPRPPAHLPTMGTPRVPDDLILSIPPDGRCLYYCVVAARSNMAVSKYDASSRVHRRAATNPRSLIERRATGSSVCEIARCRASCQEPGSLGARAARCERFHHRPRRREGVGGGGKLRERPVTIPAHRRWS